MKTTDILMKTTDLRFQEFKQLEWEGYLYWIQNRETIFPLAKEAGKLQFKCIPAYLYSVPNNNNVIVHKWSPHLKITFWFEKMIRDIIKRYLLQEKEDNDNFRMAVLSLQTCVREKEVLGYFKSGFNAIIRDDSSVMNYMVLSYDSVMEYCKIYIPINAEKFYNAVASHLYFYFIVNYDILHQKERTDNLLMKCHHREKESGSKLNIADQLKSLHTDPNILKQYLVKSFLCYIVKVEDKIEQDMANMKLHECI